MGGLTSFLLALESPTKYKGTILYAPALKLNDSEFLLKMVKLAAKLVPGKEVVDSKLMKNFISKNPDVIEDNWNHPYI